MNFDNFNSVRVELEINIGSIETTLDNVMNVKTGNVISSGIKLSETVSVVLNNKPIAQGILVEQDGCFAVEVTEVME
ncbi:hypothetical protein GTG28_15395 [Vibrio sp. OCN044]|uniref:Flagellar motor switch protein FliN-like C-terminal domain-containing protein n=1 Tax=Vibrio tetraodonis subsp. pristinus TaxID=2695891 RepID=A0A6L8LZU2_9VIBR|nr:FliM/FliN family flagellar motor C-terminal domain-containing protein [Vibrio tetraodonis]MYM60616.1 hypothetical protein [Vibrio tetraodonis subsp. pristinus]